MDGKNEGKRAEAAANAEMKDVASLNENPRDLRSVSATQRDHALLQVAKRQWKRDDEHGLFHDFPDRHSTLPNWSGQLAVATRNVDVAVDVEALANALEELAAVAMCWREAIHRRSEGGVVLGFRRKPWWKRLFRR